MADDEGLGLVELLVALVVAALVMSGVAYGITRSLWTTRDSTAREVAANLAAEAIDQARATNDYIGLAGGITTRTVDDIEYTVLQTVTAYSKLGTASPCDGTSGAFIKYKKIAIRVTWERMESSTSAVRAETLLAPGASSFDPTKGNIGAKVLGAQGQPVEGIQVTVTDGATSRVQFTDDAGCAFFEGLDPAEWTATAQSTGYVASNGSFTPSQPASVTQGYTTPVAFDMDQVGSLRVSLGSTEYPAPADVSVSLGNTALLPDGHQTFTGSGTPRDLVDRFPFASGFTVWAGSCDDADPEGTNGANGPYYPTATRGTAHLASSGVPTPVTVAMAQVRVEVRRDSTGDPIDNAQVTATHAGAAVCDTPESFVIGTTDSSGEVKASLPWGTWDFTVAGYGNAYAVTELLEPTTGAYSIEVRVL
jgi:type II secretory pathway pseudopilin PulG